MITIIKLNNGLEIVGWKEYENGEILVLKKPLQINYRYFVGPSPSVSFVRYIMFSDTHEIYFQKSHIISTSKARSSFVSVYEHYSEYYYGEHEKLIDSELKLHQKSNEEDDMKSFLDSMPVEGASIN